MLVVIDSLFAIHISCSWFEVLLRAEAVEKVGQDRKIRISISGARSDIWAKYVADILLSMTKTRVVWRKSLSWNTDFGHSGRATMVDKGRWWET